MYPIWPQCSEMCLDPRNSLLRSNGTRTYAILQTIGADVLGPSPPGPGESSGWVSTPSGALWSFFGPANPSVVDVIVDLSWFNEISWTRWFLNNRSFFFFFSLFLGSFFLFFFYIFRYIHRKHDKNFSHSL